MKPAEREDQRYKKEDFCSVSLEEETMFSLLKEHTARTGMQPERMKIIDVGCGSGRIAQQLVDLGYEVSGLDFSEQAVQKAMKNGIPAKRADLDEGIPEEDNSFHVVWAGDILEHVFDPIGLLKESNRVLKKDGIILISTPSDVGIVSRIKMLFGFSHQERMYMTSGTYKHHTFFTPRLVKFMLRKAGFELEVFKKILILKSGHYLIKMLPSAFFNEMIIQAKKQ